LGEGSQSVGRQLRPNMSSLWRVDRRAARGNSRQPRQPGIQVIQRASAILDALRQAQASLSLGQLARETGLARSTVQRIVEALQDVGWVTPPSPNGGVFLGPGLTELAAAGGRPAQLAILHPHLERLSTELNETVDLSIRSLDRALFVDQVTAHQRLRAVSAVGETFPLHCSANGKAMLATLPDPLIESLIGTSFPALTDRTITTIPALLEQVAEIRAVGASYDREEHTIGICAAGRVVPTPDGGFAAVSIPLPAQRFYGNERHLAGALSDACRVMQAALATQAGGLAGTRAR
jgi:DNA-binding IclR family transcriptional regulator